MVKLNDIAKEQFKKGIPSFGPGDTVRVWIKIIEGEKERLQRFEGTVIGISGEGISKTFSVRRISYGIGVEKRFPFHSPNIDKIEVLQKGIVRRAKLYYLRDKKGKDAKVKTERLGAAK